MKDVFGFIRRFAVAAGTVLVLCALVTVIFDPFYHYHAPLPGLKKVLTDKEYQCVGTLKTFDYDAVITGSSVMETTDLSVVDAVFGVEQTFQLSDGLSVGLNGHTVGCSLVCHLPEAVVF